MTKPHNQSVTGTPCECGFLDRSAAEPEGFIMFDERMNEYQLKRPDGTGAGPIYHCPFCGGAAPKSRRASFFARVTWAEVRRLQKLTAGLRTVEETMARFGEPQEDLAQGMTIQSPPSETEPSKTTSYRVLRYMNLSDTAMVELVDYGVQGIKFTFQGKYLRDERAG